MGLLPSLWTLSARTLRTYTIIIHFKTSDNACVLFLFGGCTWAGMTYCTVRCTYHTRIPVARVLTASVFSPRGLVDPDQPNPSNR